MHSATSQTSLALGWMIWRVENTMGHYNYKLIYNRPEFDDVAKRAIAADELREGDEGDCGYDGGMWIVADRMIRERDETIAKLRAVVQMAAKLNTETTAAIPFELHAAAVAALEDLEGP
ncbi:MAG: hypothetical protein NW202_13285 [Nitrospira sp.]|nr:hypothetical protein [Nitrospira sp.]